MKKYLLILLAILTLNCTSHEDLENIEVTVISNGILGGAGAEGITKQNLVINDNESWNVLMNQMDSVNKVSNYFSETTIDFSKFTVIAVFESVKSNGGFGLELEVASDLESVFVNIKEIVPKATDFVTTVITQPYYIIKIAKTDLPIVFQ